MTCRGTRKILSIVVLVTFWQCVDRSEGFDTEKVLLGLGLPVHAEIPVIVGYALKCNYDLPYNASNLLDEHLGRASEESADSGARGGPTPTSRWTLYRILESAMESIGSGKACLLLAVCESAANPFVEGHGLLRELLHVLLTPSTTLEEYEIYADREYSAAEVIGRNSRGTSCRSFYPECEYNPLDYFSVVHGP